MNSFIFAIGAFTNAGLALVLGVFVYLQNRKKLENLLFLLSNLCLTIWGVFFGLWQLAQTEKVAIIFCRLLTGGVIFIPVLMLHWVLILINQNKKQKLVLFFAYFISFIFGILDFTPQMVSGVRPEMFFKFWPIPGPCFIFFVIFSLVIMVYMLLLLVQNYKKSIGIKKEQLKYVFIGIFVGYLAACSTLPLWYKIQIIPFGYFFLAAYSFIIAYTIIRYQLMDIKFILGRTAVYLLSFLTILIIAFSMVLLGNKIAGLSTLSVASSLIFGITLIISMLLFNPVFRIFENFASRYFYYTFYTYQNVLANLGKKLTHVLDINELSFLITDTLLKTIKLNKIAIILKNGDYQIKGIFGFERGIGEVLAKNDFLISWLEKLKMPLSIGELSLVEVKDQTEKEKIEKFKSDMKNAEIDLCLPLLIEEKLVGMIILGPKISGDPYFKQDIDLLSALASQASIALQNARLYSEVKGFSVKLEKEVADRTEELKMANEELKKLDHVKTEFLSITSHQLKTPLAAIKGYSSLLLEGTYGKITKKTIEPIKNIQQINEKLITLITDLLNITRMDMGKMTFDFKELAMEDIVDELVTELKVIAQKKNLFLQWEKPIGLPKVFADAEKIRQVILNIIDNAIKYTRTGGVTIKAENDDSKIKIEISDTGLGIKKEEIETIFKGFDRGQNVQKAQIDGVGLGLMFARKIVEAHKGRIWAESEGENTGSTFFIELPIKK